MTCSGIATTYTCTNRFTMHNFYVAMGPAGILAATISLVAFLCSYFLNNFYVLLIIHIFLLPTNTFALPPWSGIPSGGVGVRGALSMKREEKCEKEAAADPEFGRGGHVPKVPTPLCPWTCSLRTGRVKASPVGRTLLGGHTQSALPLDTLKSEWRGGNMESGTTPPNPVQLLWGFLWKRTQGNCTRPH